MATQAENAAAGKLTDVLADAAKEVAEVAEQTDGYAYRYESFDDGSHLVIFCLGPDQDIQVETFPTDVEAGRWHPVHDIERDSASTSAAEEE